MFEGYLESTASPSQAAWEPFGRAEKGEIPIARAEAIVDSLARAHPDDAILQELVPAIKEFLGV